MKKWLTRCAVAAASILTVLLALALQAHAPAIRTGKPLPPGKVRPQLVIAQDTAVLLAPDGSLWAWGGDQFKLKNVFPQPAISQIPRRVGLDSDWTQVAAGVAHVVALKNDGSLWSWGMNDQGETGQGNLTNYIATPTRIGTETNWTQICANFTHSLALKNDGSLWAWGGNSEGELGDGTTNDRAIPTRIGTARDWRTIAASCARNFALKKNGAIWVWGLHGTAHDLTPRQIAPDTNWLAFSDCGGALVALKTDGTLWLEGTYAYKLLPPSFPARRKTRHPERRHYDVLLPPSFPARRKTSSRSDGTGIGLKSMSGRICSTAARKTAVGGAAATMAGENSVSAQKLEQWPLHNASPSISIPGPSRRNGERLYC